MEDHKIQVTEQLSLFEEYPSEWTILCTCGYVHTTQDQRTHEIALDGHAKAIALEQAKQRHPCTLPVSDEPRLGEVNPATAALWDELGRPWKDDGLGRD